MLTGKLVLVTGGNRGLGLELCRKVVASGGTVLLTSRNIALGKLVEKELCSTRPDSAIALAFDASDPVSIDELVATLRKDYDQKINILVNNAGIYPHEWTQEVFSKAINTNYNGPVQLTTKLASNLSPGASVVMVSSGLGKLQQLSSTYQAAVTSATTLEQLQAAATFLPDDPQKTGYVPAYCVSKAMLNHATQLLAQSPEFVERGISINAVCPGWCRTDMGGPTAARSPQEGMESILWAMLHSSPEVTGGFYRDGQPMPW